MCTVSVIWTADRVRLAANRDEAHMRPDAIPPAVHRFGTRCALLPIDPAGGGTWIAVNDAGLALTLLNVSRQPGARGRVVASRGAIIPALANASSLAVALDRAGHIEPREYAPFRIVLVDHAGWAEVRSDGQALTTRQGNANTPVMFTSSGLGDDFVAEPRGELFHELFARADHVRAQDRFHRHTWPDRPHLSVCMRRADARTVSHTVVTLRRDRVWMCYHPDAPDQPTSPTVRSLDIRGDVP